MNKAQFIQTWCPDGKRDEMERDLKLVINGAIEESRCFTTDLKGLET